MQASLWCRTLGNDVIAGFHLIVFPSEEDRARFVFLTGHIFSGVHYESYIFQAVSKLILCWHISKLAKFLLRPRWGVHNEGKAQGQEHYVMTHSRRESWRKKRSWWIAAHYQPTVVETRVHSRSCLWELGANHVATFCSVPSSECSSKQFTGSPATGKTQIQNKWQGSWELIPVSSNGFTFAKAAVVWKKNASPFVVLSI